MRLSILFVLVLAWPTVAITAQSVSTGTVSGSITDTSGAALTDAVISIAGTTLIGGPATIHVNRQGGYRSAPLPPGVYELTAAHAGLRPVRRTGVIIAAGSAIIIDFTLPIASQRDAIAVVAVSPVIDPTSAAVPVRLSNDLLANLPVARDVAALINLTPGVSANVGFGGSQRSNEILVDGIRTTSAYTQAPLATVNHNWVQEMNVVALGAGAEYGGFTGVVANAVLRSGANQFHGLAEHWTSRPSWLANNTRGLSETLQRQFTSRELLDWRETNGQLGGPVVRDRLWFFTGFAHTRYNDTPAGYAGDGSRDERNVQWLLKPTLSLTPNIRVEGLVERGQQRVDAEYLSVEFPLAATNDVYHPQTIWNSQAQAVIDAATLVEVRHGGYVMNSREDPHPPATRSGPYPHVDTLTGIWSQNTNLLFDSDSHVFTTSAALTRLFDGTARGSHVVKGGVEHERTTVRQFVGFPGGREYAHFPDGRTEVQLWAGTASRASTNRAVAYVQDEWHALPRLTLSPGVRLEFNRGSVPGRPNTFVTNTIAPRIGVAWDVTPNHKTVLRFHHGRYYDTIFASRIAQDDTTEDNPFITAYVVAPEQFEVISVFASEHRFAIDKALRHSHVNQTIVGVEHELFNSMSLQAQYIRRRFDDYMGLIDTGSIYVPVQRPDPGPDGLVNTADDGPPLDVFLQTNPGAAFNVYTNPPGAFNRYDAVQVVGRRRSADGGQLQTSYTWSRNRGTVGNRQHVNAAFFDLGSPGRFVNPNLGINAYGRAHFDPTHEVKLLGTHRLPWLGGAMVSGVYQYMTGQAWGRTVQVAGLIGPRLIRVEPVGTRRAPAINMASLRVEKVLPLATRGGTIGIFFDVFNVGNQGVPDSNFTNAVNERSGPFFGQPGAWLNPRTLRVGMRARF
jgi:hypothetical protein